MESIIKLTQPGLFLEAAPAGFSLEWSLEGDLDAALTRLAALMPEQSVIGLGQPLLRRAGQAIAGMRSFARIEGETAVMPETQQALWAYVRAATPGEAFIEAERIDTALGKAFKNKASLPLFRYRDGRDLTGYKDGTANPQIDEIPASVLIGDGAGKGGSFALVQRYEHFRARFNALGQNDRDNVMGRRLADDEEIEDAPETSHVKRTDQEGYDQPAFMLRRSMPWGDPGAHGLCFIAFVNDLDRMDRVLRRMCGLEDGQTDALLRYTQARTGGYYYCPPLKGGRLDLTGLR